MKNLYLKLKLVLLFVLVNITVFAQYTASNLETGLQNAALTKDGNGNVYTTRSKTGGGYEIAKYTNGSGTATVIYGNVAGDGTDLPYGLAVDSNGDVYFSSDFIGSGGKITRLAAANNYTPTIVQSGRYFTGLAFDKQDRLYALEYVLNTATYAVVRYTAPGTPGTLGATTTTGTVLDNTIPTGGYTSPTSITVAGNNYIFYNNVMDNDGSHPTAKGGIVRLATTDGITYTKTDINTTNYTSAIYVDEFNNLYAIETPSGNPGTYKLYKYVNAASPATEFYSVPFNSVAPFLPYGVVANANIVYAIDGDNQIDGGKLIKLTPDDTTPPAVPTGLAVTFTGGSKANLSWTANIEGDLNGYHIYGGTTNNPTTKMASVPSGTNTRQITGLTPGTLYYFTISSEDNFFNESNKSTSVNGTPQKPVITSAAYNATTKILTVTGTNFLTLAGADNDIAVSKLTITGEGSATRTLNSSNVETSATTFSLTLNTADQAVLNPIINKIGTSSTSANTYNLAVATQWAAGEDVSVNTAQATIALTVSDVLKPEITSATYDSQTATLVVTGTNFYKLTGATNDIVTTKFAFTGEGNNPYTLQTPTNVEITNGTTFTLVLNNADKTALSQILNRNGTSAVDNTPFNIATLEDWNAGADASVNIADLTGNAVTVSNYVNVVLPIQLVNFSHKKTNSEVVLNWSTSAEVNNKEFRLSRSVDGKDFTTIGTVNGAGNSSSLLNYSFVDKKPLIGQSYYKLTQVDLDNVVKLEKTIPVSFYIDGEDVVIYPNPATEVVNVRTNDNRYTKATLSDVNGKILGTYNLSTDVTPINVANLPKGVYLLNLSGNTENTVRKIVKN